MNTGDIAFRFTGSIPHRARVDVGATGRVTLYREVSIYGDAYDAFMALWGAVADGIANARRANLI